MDRGMAFRHNCAMLLNLDIFGAMNDVYAIK